MNWHWLGRIRNRDFVAFDDSPEEWFTAKSKQSRQQAKREKEPWLLVVSPSLKAYSTIRVVNYYRARMKIG